MVRYFQSVYASLNEKTVGHSKKVILLMHECPKNKKER